MVIPSNVKHLDQRVFEFCLKLENVQIDDGVEFIGNGCFFCCRKLKSFTMPNTVLETGKEVLLGCRSLEKVRFSAGLKKIEVGLISRCRKLTEIVLPECVEIVCNGAFAECSNVTVFEYKNPDIIMGVKVFDGCTSLLSDPEFLNRMDRFLKNTIGQK